MDKNSTRSIFWVQKKENASDAELIEEYKATEI